jgi:hypothetical protein
MSRRSRRGGRTCVRRNLKELAIGALAILATAAVDAADTATVATQRAPSFLFTRHGTRNASVLYASHGMGRYGAFFGVVDNPRTGYDELIAGVNTQWSVADSAGTSRSLLLGLAAARATDADYLQLYVIPSFTRGRLSVGGTLELYQPLGTIFGGAFQGNGRRQMELTPLQVLWRLNSTWSVGTTYVLSVAEGRGPRDRGGPALRRAVPRGSLTVDYLYGWRRSRDELRLSYRVAH